MQKHTVEKGRPKEDRRQGFERWTGSPLREQTAVKTEARKAIPEITLAQAREELGKGQGSLLLDVREPAEWEKGYIPGAVLAPRGMLEWYADPITPYAKAELTTKRDARIIVVCAFGGRSALAVETLKKIGYTNVVNMAGGFNEWSKQGYPSCQSHHQTGGIDSPLSRSICELYHRLKPSKGICFSCQLLLSAN